MAQRRFLDHELTLDTNSGRMCVYFTACKVLFGMLYPYCKQDLGLLFLLTCFVPLHPSQHCPYAGKFSFCRLTMLQEKFCEVFSKKDLRRILTIDGYYVSVKRGILCQSFVLFKLLRLFIFSLKGFRRWEIMIVSIFYIKLKTDTTGHSWH